MRKNSPRLCHFHSGCFLLQSSVYRASINLSLLLFFMIASVSVSTWHGVMCLSAIACVVSVPSINPLYLPPFLPPFPGPISALPHLCLGHWFQRHVFPISPAIICLPESCLISEKLNGWQWQREGGTGHKDRMGNRERVKQLGKDFQFFFAHLEKGEGWRFYYPSRLYSSVIFHNVPHCLLYIFKALAQVKPCSTGWVHESDS